MSKIGPSSGDAQEPTPPPPSTLPTGRVEVKALENLSPSIGGVKIKVEEKGRQQELARKTLDKEYVQSKKHGYATNLWTAQVQGTPARSGSSGRLLPPRAFTNRCAAYVTATFGTGLVCMCVYVRARACVCSEGIDASWCGCFPEGLVGGCGRPAPLATNTAGGVGVGVGVQLQRPTRSAWR